MSTTEIAAVQELARITRALDRIEKNTRPRSSSGMQKTVDGMAEAASMSWKTVLSENIPVELDWLEPPVRSKVSFEETYSGRIVVKFVIEGEDAAIVKDLLTSLPVESLQLSAVQP